MYDISLWSRILKIYCRTRRFSAFPPVLVVEQTNGAVDGLNWNKIVGLNLEKLLGTGIKDQETLLPEPRPVTPVKKKSDFLAPPTSGKRGRSGEKQ